MKADMIIQPVSDNQKAEWNKLASHPLQTWEWGDFRKSQGIDVVRLGKFEHGKLKQVCQLTFHRIPYTPWTIGYFPKGPAPDKTMIHELIKLGKKKRAVFIQLEPNILKSSLILKPSHHPLFTKYTFILDLTKNEEQLLNAMHPKTRYNIRVAQKHGVVVAEDNSDEAFGAYLSLSEETTNRQKFYAHNRQYHTLMWRALSKQRIARLFIATYQGKTLAAWILFVWGDTVYYPYGASSREHREVMAPNLLMWEIMRWAKTNRLKRFDLWGALGPHPDPHDPWYGFHRFKEGFRPELIEYVGSYDLVLTPLLYRLYTAADTLRWVLLRARKQ